MLPSLPGENLLFDQMTERDAPRHWQSSTPTEPALVAWKAQLDINDNMLS